MLASGSPYRAQVLRDAGYRVEVDPPEVDERALDEMLHTDGPDALAEHLARLKCLDVVARHPGATVVAGDQVGVLGAGPARRLLSKTSDVETAVGQLMSMGGTVHHLHSALVVALGPDGPLVSGVDVATVTMRHFTPAQARAYVEDFEPFDTAGSYRIEDQEHLPASQRLVAGIDVEHRSGIMGMPLGLLERLLAELAAVGDQRL
ncbi:MAG: Maf family protein [Microthrixaceae bacterium]